ncbi:MAG: 30S ribosomal protein S20, partial [Bifidobacterium crudilactis]|nr:30S ribosomal protein S20 [Bifidobacterium crudilactis]
MANIKSQKKRVITNDKAHERNIAVKSSIKTAVRSVHEAVESGDKAA